MKRNLVLSIERAFALLAGLLFVAPSVARTVSINFDAVYTMKNYYSQPTPSTPVATTLSFEFHMSPEAPAAISGSTYMLLATGAATITANSPIFDLLPQPHIRWAPLDQGNVYIRKSADAKYQFVATLGHSENSGCPMYCMNYFKALEVVSLPITVVDFDPFLDPLHFIQYLASTSTAFESNLSQTLDYRSRTTGAYLGTSLYTIGQGSLWQGGGAWISTLSASPVPEPSTCGLLSLGVTALLLRSRTRYHKTPSKV